MGSFMAAKWLRIAVVLIGTVTLGGAAAGAQTDVGASFYGTFTGSTQGDGTAQKPSNSAGGMLEIRHISNPFLGYEVTYSFNPANQSYAPVAGSCGFLCSNQPETLTAKANQVAIDWIGSMKRGNLRPFVVGGLGFFITVPSLALGNINTVVRPMYVYGGGFDWGMLPHIGLRIQYRGDVYKAPNLDSNYAATGAFTQTAEPMAGIYFRL